MSDEEIISVYPWIIKKARKYCCDSDDAKDLAEETIYKVLINREKYDCSRPFKSWVLAIMQNTYITMYNRSMVIKFTGIEECRNMCVRQTEERAEFMDVLSAIRKLYVRYNSIECVIYYAKGYTYLEISKKMGIPIGTVMSRINLARKLISKELKHKC